MADLVLEGLLDLAGNLQLEASSGGKVKVGAVEALVVGAEGQAPPVILPPPPASPSDPAPGVKIISSFNQTVMAGGKAVVAQGMVMQGNTWPGMVLPSTANPTVTINGLPVNVIGDQATIFPSGAPATFAQSGQ
jgi:uncharacterized Zn-binding protein involved in type VI secretion